MDPLAAATSTTDPAAAAAAAAAKAAAASSAPYDLSWMSGLSKLPDVQRQIEAIRKGLYKSPTVDDTKAYAYGEHCGLFEDYCDADGHDAPNWEAKKIAYTASSSVVGVTCPSLGYRSLGCSGIIVECNGMKKILTSANIGLSGDAIAICTEVDVLLPNQKKVTGVISYVDRQHNIALIHSDLAGMKGAIFDTTLVDLGDSVTAVGRHHGSSVMASQGKINIRGDHLESDDLMSSSCTISGWGIGGPLINNSSGKVVGMNFFSKKGFTPFMPSIVLLKCVEHLLDRGIVMRPWLGLKMRSLIEMNTESLKLELELIYSKFHSLSGLIVKEVTKGSPADEAGICVDDVIISCNDTPVSSPIQFAEEMFKMVESPRGVKRRAKTIEVGIQRVSSGLTMAKSILVRDSTTPVINGWPVLPYPFSL